MVTTTTLLFLFFISCCNAWSSSPIPTSRAVHHQRNQFSTRLLSSSPSPSPTSPTIPYNWKDQWYAVTYANYLPNPSKSAEVTPVSIFGEPLVLWRSEDNGIVYCANDVCPHRSAALSEGRVRDGKLECYYHG